MSSIQLTFINESNDDNNSSIVIFQKNEKNNNHTTAWHVIRDIGKGWSHTIKYPVHVEIAARDSWKNYTPKITAEPGQSFEATKVTSGDVLNRIAQSTTSPTDIQFSNKMESDSMDALIYRDGRLLAEVNGIAPGKSTNFNFEPTIYINVVAASEIKEGEPLDSKIVNSDTTKLSLKGIKSGKIIMTGGGSGKDSKPLNFELVTNSSTK